MNIRQLLCIVSLSLLSQAEAETYTACYEEWSPYAYSEGGGHKGLAIEAAQTAFSAMGHTLNLQAAPYARCIAEAKGDKLIGVFFATPEEFDCTESKVALAYWVIAAFVPQDAPHQQWTGPVQFKGQRLGTVTGYIYPDDVANFSDWKPDATSDATQNLQKLAAKRVDVVFEDLLWGSAVAKERNLAIRPLSPVVANQPSYLCISKKHATLATQFDEQINKLKQSGALDRLFVKHTGKTLQELEQLK